MEVQIVDEGDAVYLETSFPGAFDHVSVAVAHGDDLPPVRLADAHFENRDGTPLLLEIDLAGVVKQSGWRYPAGPLASLRSGTGRTRVW